MSESTRGLMVECSSQWPSSHGMRAAGTGRRDPSRGPLSAGAPAGTRRGGDIPGRRGKARALGSALAWEAGLPCSHQLGQRVAGQGDGWGPRQLTLRPLSSALWFSKGAQMSLHLSGWPFLSSVDSVFRTGHSQTSRDDSTVPTDPMLHFLSLHSCGHLSLLMR